MSNEHTETPERDAKGRWRKGVSGNAGGRSRASGLVRDAIAERLDDVLWSLFFLIEHGDVAAIKLALEGVSPALKADTEPLEIAGLEQAETLGQKAEVVIREIARGTLDAERGARVLAGIGSAAQLSELDELKSRLAALESRDIAS